MSETGRLLFSASFYLHQEDGHYRTSDFMLIGEDPEIDNITDLDSREITEGIQNDKNFPKENGLYFIYVRGYAVFFYTNTPEGEDYDMEVEYELYKISKRSEEEEQYNKTIDPDEEWGDDSNENHS